MGSLGNPNTWPPYKDCSQGICSIYCPQWCYIIFPPPPPFLPPEDDSATNFSPLIIAVIGILATAFLLVSYYTIISKYCRRRGQNHDNPTSEFELNHNQISQDNWQVASTGLDESLIKSIAVFKYKKGDGLMEGSTECAVCLNEFQQDESLRLLPKCDHAFHLPCIDKWLRSHSNCPLCRSDVANSTPLTLPSPNSQSSSTLNISSLEIQQRNDMILVVPLPFQGTSDMQSSEIRNNMIEENGQEGVHQQFRRSISLGSFSCQRHLLIDDLQGENIQSPLKRSISTGRFIFTRHEKGKNSILPN